MARTTRHTGVSEQLRKAVDASGKSRYRICKDLGISETTMSRFMASQRGLSLRLVDRLCAYLGLELRKTKQKGR